MIEALVVSNVILWILVIGLAFVVFALARQVGILHERVAPAGALMPTNGPKVGEQTEALSLTDIAANTHLIGGPEPGGRSTLVLFISPTCPVCKSLVPTAQSLAKAEDLRLVFASDGDNIDQHRAYVADLGISQYPYLLSQRLGLSYQVSKLPFALLIGGDGTLRGKGLVNTREHLESLVEARDTGVATLQEYVAAHQEEPDNSVKEQAV